jgi:hypothetical protein
MGNRIGINAADLPGHCDPINVIWRHSVVPTRSHDTETGHHDNPGLCYHSETRSMPDQWSLLYDSGRSAQRGTISLANMTTTGPTHQDDRDSDPNGPSLWNPKWHAQKAYGRGTRARRLHSHRGSCLENGRLLNGSPENLGMGMGEL